MDLCLKRETKHRNTFKSAFKYFVRRGLLIKPGLNQEVKATWMQQSVSCVHVCGVGDGVLYTWKIRHSDRVHQPSASQHSRKDEGESSSSCLLLNVGASTLVLRCASVLSHEKQRDLGLWDFLNTCRLSWFTIMIMRKQPFQTQFD